jgi:hypothetical protein
VEASARLLVLEALEVKTWVPRVKRAPGVGILAIILLVSVGYSTVYSLRAETFGIGVVILLLPEVCLALGLVFLRPWAWWMVILFAPPAFLIGAVSLGTALEGLLSSEGNGAGTIGGFAWIALLLAGAGGGSLYLLKRSVRVAFGSADGPLPDALPPFSLDKGCFVILAIAIAYPVLFALAMAYACLYGGDCL